MMLADRLAAVVEVMRHVEGASGFFGVWIETRDLENWPVDDMECALVWKQVENGWFVVRC